MVASSFGVGAGAGSGPGPVAYVCIHGHFYQPPRENPWLEAIEVQDGAAPYHDWNERITAECYEPNAFARILDGSGRIARITSNYERMSYNFGPTLLSWLSARAPGVYQAILRADEASARRFSGHGSAMAQPYNHMILPLANLRDKRTQLIWGLRDFKTRFERAPEGVWLPESAVDLESLDIAAELGLSFTVLAPHQAQAVRSLAEGARGKAAPGYGQGHEQGSDGQGDGFIDVSGGRIDPGQAYRLNLPSGRSIAVFFYDGPISRAVAFERLLNNGEDFIARLAGARRDSGTSRESGGRGAAPQLIHVATDGETYGHHHKYGEMALAYALEAFEQQARSLRLTNYGEFLARHPPTHEVKIFEQTSWSCAHGVERWRSDCGCRISEQASAFPGQRFRAPMRRAFDELRDGLSRIFEEVGGGLLKDPWLARDEYIDVILDFGAQQRERLSRTRARFLRRHAAHALSESEQVSVWMLLDMQRHAQLMYTSCGWFFDDISGTEAVQDLAYAGRALQLSRAFGGEKLEAPFLSNLELAPSSKAETPNGRAVFEKHVRPAMIELDAVAAHSAMKSLVLGEPTPSRVSCYAIDATDQDRQQTGKLRLAVGRLRVQSDITLEAGELCYSVLYLGDHNIVAGVGPDEGEAPYRQLQAELSAAFLRADLPELLRVIDRHFPTRRHSLKSMFRDEQRRVIAAILDTPLRTVEAELFEIYQNSAPLLRSLADLGVPAPAPLLAAARLSLHSALRTALSRPPLDPSALAHLRLEAERAGVLLDGPTLSFALSGALDILDEKLRTSPLDVEILRQLDFLTSLAETPPFEVNLFRTQNTCYELLPEVYPGQRLRARTDKDAARWLEAFTRLCNRLRLLLPTSPTSSPQLTP